MKIRFDENDFEKLCTTSMKWDVDLANQERWENLGSASYDLTYWSFAYWVSDWAHVILMRSWLDERFHPYDIVWDLATEEYTILTDYSSPVWTAQAGKP